ncbi:Mediator of RNA polymerase II transcription subunit 3 [Nakaseomyces bracarensis]|uniref:Mediator of RNA polymerase II transcription subunit 3 n=1 Tax=Nakaseomyces bracarensis TaxID=273131 RepID=A0ABR4NS43_9SACH
MSNNINNDINKVESLGEILLPGMRLADLEVKLSEDDKDSCKSILHSRIKRAEDAILPLRLQFNDFTQIMASLDEEKMSSISNEEKFQMIRSKVLGIAERLQSLSTEFEELQPLFATVNEYSEKYNNKNFQVLQILNGYNHMGKAGTISGGTPAALSSTPINPNLGNTATSSNAKKVTKNAPTPGPSVTTPSSSNNIATPGSATTPAAQGKKPRKPRQTKKQQQQAAAAAAAAAAQTQGPNNSQGRTPSVGMGSNTGTPILTNPNMKSVQTPVPPSITNPISMPGNVPLSNQIASPGNMTNKNKGNSNSMLSPLAGSAHMNQMFNIQGQGNQFQNQQPMGNKGGSQFNDNSNINNSNNSNDLGMGMNNPAMNMNMGMGMNMGMNMNQITPANILSMNTSKASNDSVQQLNSGNMMMMDQNNNLNTNNNNNNNGGNNNNPKNAYDLVDLNSLDLSSLNMDFL